MIPSVSHRLSLIPAMLGMVLPAAAAPEAAPQVLRAEAAATVLFQPVLAEKSGVKHVPQVHNENPLSFLYHSGFVVGGVAIGDVNGDGKQDLVFAGTGDKNAVYVQRSAWQFEDVTPQCGPGVDGGEAWSSGVTLVDADADGDLDLYVCNYESPNQLFLNGGVKEGVPQFREAAAAAGLAAVDSSHSSYWADFDGDGDLDMFLLTNKVEDPKGFASEDRPPVFMDGNILRIRPEMERYYDLWRFDRDNFGSESIGRPDYLFRNDGVQADGVPHFTDVTKAAGISGRGDGLSATVWDYDQDGRPDIFVGNDFLSEDRLWHNNGNGTFTNVLPQVAPHTCWFSMGADAGDLNNDLHPDFLLADMAATTHYKSKTTMGAMGGMNLKRAVTSPPPQYMRNTCLIGTGAERFLEGAYLLGIASTDWTWAVKFGDYDLDGWQDIYITNGVIRAMNHSDHVVDQAKVVNHHQWEFYKDMPARPEQHRAYQNEGHFHFKDSSEAWGLNRTAVTYGCAQGDMDGDGDLDLVEVNLEEPPSLYRNTAVESGKGNWVAFRLRGAKANPAAIGAKIVIETAEGKQMRELFPVSGYHSCNEALLHFGLGKAKTIAKATVTWPDGTVQTLDAPAAGKTHAVTQPAGLTKPASAPAAPAAPAKMFAKAADFPQMRHVELPYDDYADQILLPHALSRLGPAVAWADVNGDGADDVFMGGAAGQMGELRLGDGKGGFSAQWVQSFATDKACEDMGAVFFDADGDGDADLFVASGSYEFKSGDERLRDRLYLNDGKGGFTKAPAAAIPDFREASGPVCVADFDRDGKFDIYVGSRVVPGSYPSFPKSRLLRNVSQKGKVAFADVTDEMGEVLRQSGMVSGAVWSDVTGDGWPDLLLAHEWGTVSLFVNDKGRLQLRQGVADDLTKRSGWWLSVDTADLDGDGDLDIVAGNFGYNTKYKEATPEKPKLLYFGDMDGSGKKNIVEVKREGDVLYPERGRSCSSTAMPMLKTKFPTYEKFALAKLDEVYGDKLQSAEKFEANTLGTGIFWNEGKDGSGNVTFRYEALDRLAQVAPAFGLGLADFDGDGRTDIFLAQNFHSPQIETGRYDGGLSQLMLNKGKHFEPVPAGTSGLVIPGDAKAATVCDINGDGAPDVAVSINAGPLEVWVNKSAAAGLTRRVRVKAGALAAGAKVRASWEGGSALHELHAGGGYLSQAAGGCFLSVPKAAVVALAVTWADGTESTQTIPAGENTTVLKKPSATATK